MVLKPNCVSCDAELEMTEGRFHHFGNYCKKCDLRAEKMAKLRVDIRSPFNSDWEKDNAEAEFAELVAECKQYININFNYIGVNG